MPAAKHVSPDSEDESAFGSFTGNDTRPSSSWVPSSQVETAREYISEAEQQAPDHLHSLTGSTLSAAAQDSEVASQAPVRPAAAAATAAVLQSRDRSAPISLGLFGEESYEDPAIELPPQAALQGPATDSQQGAVPISPRQLPSATAELQRQSPGRLPPQPQLSGPLHDFKAQHKFPQYTFQTEHKLDPSWQQAMGTQPPTQSSSSFLPEAPWQDTAQDDFSPSWQQADADDFGASWHQAPSDNFPPSATPFPAVDINGFAATWPQLTTSADLHHQLPKRQAASGPISSELFGLEEREDEPLELPVQATDSNTVLSTHSELVSGPQQSDSAAFPARSDPDWQMDIAALTPQASSLHSSDAVQSQQSKPGWQSEPANSVEQSAPTRQTSPGPISLELFGMEETEDAPLDLPVQASITVLPTAASNDSKLVGTSLRICHPTCDALQQTFTRVPVYQLLQTGCMLVLLDVVDAATSVC